MPLTNTHASRAGLEAGAGGQIVEGGRKRPRSSAREGRDICSSHVVQVIIKVIDTRNVPRATCRAPGSRRRAGIIDEALRGWIGATGMLSRIIIDGSLNVWVGVTGMSRDGGRLAGVSRAGCGYLERRTDNANPARRGRVRSGLRRHRQSDRRSGFPVCCGTEADQYARRARVTATGLGDVAYSVTIERPDRYVRRGAAASNRQGAVSGRRPPNDGDPAPPSKLISVLRADTWVPPGLSLSTHNIGGL